MNDYKSFGLYKRIDNVNCSSRSNFDEYIDDRTKNKIVYAEIKHYRLDKMMQISLCDKARADKEFFGNFDIVAYTKTSF